MPRHAKPIAASLLLLALASASAASARPGGWGGPSASEWGNSRWDHPTSGSRRGPDDREGAVNAASFAAEDEAVRALGHGAVAVEFAAGDGPLQDNAAYEAAVIDQMVKAGYDTTSAAADAGQIAELRIVRSEIEPAETKRNPVSGEMEMGVSNRGSTMGLGINLDFSKPKKALVSTRLETRIRDKASGKVLWEGRADIATRDGDSSDQAIATKLAQAMFEKFPGGTERPYR